MNKDFLKKLLSTNTPDGRENVEGIKLFNSYCKEFANHEFTDSISNSAFSVGNGNIPFMVSAHIDEVSMYVQYIDDNGFIHVIANGIIDANILSASRVVIMNNKGFVTEGIIGNKPAHLNPTNNGITMSDIKIDCGFENKIEAMKVVNIGDSVMYKSDVMNLGSNRLTGKGFDDKIGIFVVCSVLKELSSHNLKNLKVYGVAMTQEEVGGYGAITATKKINPKYSIDYDAHFATDDGNVDPKDWANVKLGSGGAICYSPDCNISLSSIIKNVCINQNIKFQEFCKPNGMTNTLNIRNSSDDVQTALLSFPLRNMHTPVEVCDYRDIQSLIDMTVKTILFMDLNIKK